MFKLIISPLVIVFLVGCAAAPPKNTSNLCEIFTEKKGWYKDKPRVSLSGFVPPFNLGVE